MSKLSLENENEIFCKIFDMRDLLIMSHIVFFILLYFVPFVITDDDYHWVPKQVSSLRIQCIRRGYRGSCDLSTVYGHNHRKNIGICNQLLCAKRVPPEYVGESAGTAYIGTPCDVNKVCNEKRECVTIPKNKMPMVVGHQQKLTCIQRSTFETRKLSDCVHLCAINDGNADMCSCSNTCYNG